MGDILEASGWTAALTEAEIASSGTADSFLKVSHLTRTRHAQQVTLLTLETCLTVDQMILLNMKKGSLIFYTIGFSLQ